MKNKKKSKCTDKLVTDGKKIYRLARRFKTPKGLTEIFYIKKEKIYDSEGYLLNKFTGFQGVEPRFNPKKSVLAVNYALSKGLYHDS